MTAEKQFGPTCIICDHKDPVEEFASEGWFQIDINKGPGPINLIWVCPKCLGKTRVCVELEQQLTKATKRINDLEEEQFPLVEGYGKVMDIMAKLGHLIDKAKTASK